MRIYPRSSAIGIFAISMMNSAIFVACNFALFPERNNPVDAINICGGVSTDKAVLQASKPFISNVILDASGMTFNIGVNLKNCTGVDIILDSVFLESPLEVLIENFHVSELLLRAEEEIDELPLAKVRYADWINIGSTTLVEFEILDYNFKSHILKLNISEPLKEALPKFNVLDFTVSDPIGTGFNNGDGRAQFGEDVSIDVNLIYSGAPTVSDLTASVESNLHEESSLTGTRISTTSIAPNGNFSFNCAFRFKNTKPQPNQNIFFVVLETPYGIKWQIPVSLKPSYSTPPLALSLRSIVDRVGTANNNGNGKIDPSETVELTLDVQNLRNNSFLGLSSNFSLTPEGTEITSGSFQSLGDFQSGEKKTTNKIVIQSGAHTSIGDAYILNYIVSTSSGGEFRGSIALKTMGHQSIAFGYGHSWVVDWTGALRSYGYNYNMSVGPVNSNSYFKHGNIVNQFDSQPMMVAAGYEHACALLETGALKCWGNNSYGQMGIGSDSRGGYLGGGIFIADVVGLSDGVISVASGSNHACALTDSSIMKCWGSFGWDLISRSPIDFESDVKSIAAGGSLACAIKSGGSLNCFGNGILTRISVQSGVTSVALGGEHGCYVKDGAVFCWGKNDYGQLGDGKIGINQTYPVAVSGLSSGVFSVSAGAAYSCALLETGGLKCWGRNYGHKLGVATAVSLPTSVVGLESGIRFVSTGYGSTCAVSFSGNVSCWGENRWSQLGFAL